MQGFATGEISQGQESQILITLWKSLIRCGFSQSGPEANISYQTGGNAAL